jgi:hypothetical protein
VKVVLQYSDASKSLYETAICMSRTIAVSITYCKEGNYIKPSSSTRCL